MRREPDLLRGAAARLRPRAWWRRVIGRLEVSRECRAYAYLGPLPFFPEFYGCIDRDALAVEKMLGVTVPYRCQMYRVVLNELSRIVDHMICLAAMSMELGAFTPFLYCYRERERANSLFEKLTGRKWTKDWWKEPSR